jgi:hypothetical protein
MFFFYFDVNTGSRVYSVLLLLTVREGMALVVSLDVSLDNIQERKRTLIVGELCTRGRNLSTLNVFTAAP